MKKSSKLVYLFILLFSIIHMSSVLASESSGTIGLLTVSEYNTTERGGIAKLSLTVKPGSGRIFIDSFPLSKLDTQITMRFASEVACDLLEKDCSNYDFFYTITASSAVVGGPSAGAAATVLTVAVLDGQELKSDVIMTGTINSGNLIGPVAGISAKTKAADDNGYNIVMIPRWDNVNNTPFENLTIQVIKISKLEEALYYFTGKNYSTNTIVDINKGMYAGAYSETMKRVTLDLCTKYSKDGLEFPSLIDYGINITNSSQNNFALAKDALSKELYYSAASFCFSGNAKITSKLLENYSQKNLKLEYAKLLGEVSDFETNLDEKYSAPSTISALESYMIVAERLSESKSILEKIDPNNVSSERLAYAMERFSTAKIWLEFYNLDGQEFIMDKELLKLVCTKKLSEAEERVNYMELYYPDSSLREDLMSAYDYYYNSEYSLCIFTSSKVKADANVVLSVIFISINDTASLLEEKLDATKKVMSRQSEKGVFPIIGYSYFEYARTLGASDAYSGLIYAEYALELSNLEMYFEKKNFLDLDKQFDFYALMIFVLGMILGIVLTLIFIILIIKKNSNSSNVVSIKKHSSKSRKR